MTDDEIAVDTVEQQLESSDTEQDISTDVDDSGDMSSEQHTAKPIGSKANLNDVQELIILSTKNQVLWALEKQVKPL